MLLVCSEKDIYEYTRYLQCHPEASNVRTTRELLSVLHTLAKNPLGVQRAEEVDPGVGHQKIPDVLEATKETARHANSKSECKSHLVQPESPLK